jgi:hypothetical protein
MGGGSANQTNQQSLALANTESSIAQQYLNNSQTQLAAGNALEQPAVNYYKNLTSGNPQTVLQASAPAISNITQQSEAAKANIWNTVPGGAARDVALSQVQQGQSGQVASTLNNTVNNAYTSLAQIGAAQQGVGLGEAGVGTTGISGAQGAYGQVANNQAQQKSSTLGFLGSIFGAAGNAAGGYFSNH